MLSSSSSLDSTHFQMGLIYENNIHIRFYDIFSFLNECGDHVNKIIFIDPVVLSNNDFFLNFESSTSKVTLVPTNLHEGNKDLDSLKSILDMLENHGIGRRGDIVCAIGGGALLDTVAFAASIYRRGIAVIKVPTTLLGIIDASIGIKTGINYLGQRNRLGSYHFDYNVIIDPKLMIGMHRNLVRQGLGEIFKIAVIKSKDLYDFLKLHKSQLENVDFFNTIDGRYILVTSIKLMLEELHDNPREDNLMRCVDYGHSFSPLVEMESLKRAGSRSLPHGYAVAYDCILTATISMNRDILPEAEYLDILSLYKTFDFDFKNDIYSDYNLLWASFLEMKKHRGGNQNLPIPINIGSYSFIQDVNFEEVKSCSLSLQKILNL
jgi:3-dehydroquinate synthetase